MPEATQFLRKPCHLRRESNMVEAYQDETQADSTYVDLETTVRRMSDHFTPKAQFPDTGGAFDLTPVVQEAFARACQVANAAAQAARSIVRSAASGSSESTAGYNGGSQPSDYYVR